MKFIVVLFFAMLAVAASQRRRIHPRLPVLHPLPVYPQYGDEEYAASLAGAPVGVYRKQSGSGGFGGYGGPLGDSEVSGISLGGSKVGLYGRDHSNY